MISNGWTSTTTGTISGEWFNNSPTTITTIAGVAVSQLHREATMRQRELARERALRFDRDAMYALRPGAVPRERCGKRKGKRPCVMRQAMRCR